MKRNEGNVETKNYVNTAENGDGEEIERQVVTTHSLILPSSVLIVTNITDAVFTKAEPKAKFELLFFRFDVDAKFQYLKTFHRARICFTSIASASEAHNQLDKHNFMGQNIRCYYAELPVEAPEDAYLKPPPLGKQYLISPPASPPLDWEVIAERTPALNYDLINAIAAMGPGKSYEMHTGNDSQPSIVVHICDDPEGYDTRPSKIEQTRRPDSSSNAK